jgi:hypothetical protein
MIGIGLSSRINIIYETCEVFLSEGRKISEDYGNIFGIIKLFAEAF